MDKVILTLAIISILFGVSQQAKLERRSSALDIELEEDSVEFLGKKASVENIFKDIFHVFDGKREETRTKRASAAYLPPVELAGPTTVPSTTNQRRKRPNIDYGPKAGYCQGRLFCK